MNLELRTRLAWLWLIARYRWAYIAGVIGLGISLATISTSSSLAMGVAALALVLGVAGVVADHRNWAEARADLSIRRSDLTASPSWEPFTSLVQLGYVRDSVGLSMLYSPQLNAVLRGGGDAQLILNSGQFKIRRPSGVVAAVILRRWFRSDAVLFNARKVTLCDDLGLQDEQLRPVKVRQSRYFDMLLTNQFSQEEVYSKAAGTIVHRGSDLFVDDGKVLPLHHSDCSNSIGVSTLAVTSDGVVVIGRQGAANALTPNMLVPSGSGSADWRDALDAPSFRAFVISAAERELLEECGLPKTTSAHSDLVAYGRVLDRGGKPEFFCFTQLEVPFRSLKISRSERLFTFEHEPLRLGEANELRRELVKFREKHRHALSATLSIQLWAMEDALASGWVPSLDAAQS